MLIYRFIHTKLFKKCNTKIGYVRVLQIRALSTLNITLKVGIFKTKRKRKRKVSSITKILIVYRDLRYTLYA